MPIGDSEDILFVGVDVGTGSARAGLVDRNGRVLKSATKTITTWSPRPNYYQQSTEDIWDAICYAVRVSKDAPIRSKFCEYSGSTVLLSTTYGLMLHCFFVFPMICCS